MGQYRLFIAFKLCFGISFYIEPYSQLEIILPFIFVSIGLMKQAKGIRFFKDAE